MRQFKGSPGPWLLRMEATFSAAWPVIFFDDGEQEFDICALETTYEGKGGKFAKVIFDEDPLAYDRRGNADEIEANARLIAAAPELLDAIESDWADALYAFIVTEFAADPATGEAVTSDVRPHFEALCDFIANRKLALSRALEEEA